MKRPIGDLNQLIRTVDAGARFTINDVRPEAASVKSILSDADDQYLAQLVAMIRSGKSAVVIVDTANDTLKYLFSNASRAGAVVMMGKVLESNGRRMEDGGAEA